MIEGRVATSAPQTMSFRVAPMTDANAALTLGATTQGTLALPGDRMRYSFTLAEDALLLFDSLTNNGSLNWPLTGPSGVIDGRNFNNSDPYQRDDATPFFSAAGDRKSPPLNSSQ